MSILFFLGIHGYTVNDRLFTEPVNVNDQGASVCPGCLTTRKQPTAESPGFVRYLLGLDSALSSINICVYFYF